MVGMVYYTYKALHIVWCWQVSAYKAVEEKQTPLYQAGVHHSLCIFSLVGTGLNTRGRDMDRKQAEDTPNLSI